MQRSVFKSLFKAERPVIGMLHLLPLPGSPRARQFGVQGVIDAALFDAEALVQGGVNGLMLENFGDLPFYPGRVAYTTVATMTAVAQAVRTRFDLPLGINVLRNDGLSALAIAVATGAAFIRVNVLCSARLTDQGMIEGIAHDLLRERSQLNAEGISIFADIDVKHSAALAVRPLAEETEELIHRALADAVIVSGYGTGAAALVEDAQQVRQAAHDTPVLIGSGISEETIAKYLPFADGFIVGTSLKEEGRIDRPVDQRRVKALLRAIQT